MTRVWRVLTVTHEQESLQRIDEELKKVGG